MVRRLANLAGGRSRAVMEPFSPSFATQIGRIVLMTLPFLVGVFCVLLSFVPFGMVFGTSAVPAFGLMAVYYWAVTRPEVFPPYAILAVGLLFDLLSAGPIGLWALVYIVVYGVVVSQQMLFFGRTFFVFWIGFVGACSVAGVVAWAVGSLYFTRFLSPAPIMTQLVITIIFYPPFATFFGWVQGRLSLQA